MDINEIYRANGTVCFQNLPSREVVFKGVGVASADVTLAVNVDGPHEDYAFDDGDKRRERVSLALATSVAEDAFARLPVEGDLVGIDSDDFRVDGVQRSAMGLTVSAVRSIMRTVGERRR